MLTFFRRIRKLLLEGGASSKYLLYADNGYRFFLSDAEYEAFKNTGFEILINSILQKGVIKLFEIAYPKLSVALGWGAEGSMWTAQYMDEIFLRTNVPGGNLKPFDFDDRL